MNEETATATHAAPTGAAQQAEERLFITTTPNLTSMATFAVAVLDDGSQVRMRNLGDRVEVRTWDLTHSCQPPHLDVTRVGGHVVDISIPAETGMALTCDYCHHQGPTTEQGDCGMCSSRSFHEAPAYRNTSAQPTRTLQDPTEPGTAPFLLEDLPVEQRDGLVAAVWAFLSERGYTITHTSAVPTPTPTPTTTPDDTAPGERR